MAARIQPFYLFAIAVLAAGGIPKGYDEGGFSASVTLSSFKQDYNLIKANWKHDPTGLANRTANITSFGVLGAAFGALIAFFCNDKLGRLWSFRCSILVWASGLLIQVFSSGIFGFLLFSRMWSGLGAGALTVVSPLFLSEIAPAKTRGMTVSIYMVMLLSFLSLGFFVNHGANLHLSSTRMQYRLVQSIPLIPVGLVFIGSFFMPDSPRWLASKGRHTESVAALARLRGMGVNDPELLAERAGVEMDSASIAEMKNASLKSTAVEVLTSPTLRSRFLLALAMQTISQWTGGNGITYYISDIFQYAGITGSNTSIITSGAYGLVKLLFTMIFAWGLIDMIGRRRCFMAGLSLQCATHIYMAVYFGTIPDTNESASNAAVASVFVYAIGWSIGLCTIPYIYGTELFPTKVRSLCYAVVMAAHWFFQFAVVRVTPLMLASLDKWGAYTFWACICASGLVILGLWAPETKGIPMERMDELFQRPWYKCGSAKVSIDSFENSYRDGTGEKAGALHVEKAV
ncbi:general substrate transporter [Aureobasidium pullulans]|uniref:General substrate transporter n=1 Tax=Aureobasidium pullulans TaxID=5580 RepID=A0A4S9WYC0_AURPU|nr:general substrate transporter [Aureobasidium pullulans]